MKLARHAALGLGWLATIAGAYFAGRTAHGADPATSAAATTNAGALVATAAPQRAPATPVPCRATRSAERAIAGRFDDDGEARPTEAATAASHASEASDWHDDVAEEWGPERIRRIVDEVARDRDLAPPELDCDEFPCVAQFGPEVSDADRDATVTELQRRLGVGEPLCQMMAVASSAPASDADDALAEHDAGAEEVFHAVALAPANTGDPGVQARCEYRMARWRNDAFAAMHDLP